MQLWPQQGGKEGRLSHLQHLVTTSHPVAEMLVVLPRQCGQASECRVPLGRAEESQPPAT